ncbi:uncharacterized protein LOC112213331 [Bombus impatiens]|uniref:Uncharacterized protein LOC112213331 n=1 Tax=Bombus impatiens TaxID=132113 RepID=A0A6P6FFL1_BOMIM|nr:uncharacterized protein LOC112213331 [Bombus impatiens]
MEEAITPIWRQLPDVVNGTLIRRKLGDLRIELRIAGLFHNIAPNTSPDNVVSARGDQVRYKRYHKVVEPYYKLTYSSTAQTSALVVRLVTCTQTGQGLESY